VDQLEYQRDLESLRKALGEATFLKIWREGEGMTLEDVIYQALAGIRKESIQSEKEKSGGLTGRERQVALLISQGKSNREIAEEMTIGVKTVETYITRILNKLAFDSRVSIATWMVEKNFEKTEESRARPSTMG
jgi:non-specific serine/threonine protein kinase